MPAPTFKRTLTAIVVADVVGYSRLMGADEAGTLRRLTQYRAEIVDPTVARFGGRIVNAVGDSLLFEFASVVEATLCAIAVQSALAEKNRSLEEVKRILLRMGVNIGDVIVRDRTLFGDGVNVAARLQALASPGGLCLSSAAHEQIAGKIDADFADLGPHQVKNIAREIRVFGLSAEAIGRLPPLAPPAARPSRVSAALAAGALAVILAAGGVYFWRRAAAPDFGARMTALLATTQAKQSERARAKTVADYLAIAEHKAFAIAPKAQSHWWTGDWPNAEVAAEKVLERCQLAFDEPCQLVAADLQFEPSADAASPREMSRLAYAGRFEPGQIPAIRQVTAERPDVVGYAGAAAPKAVAIHPRGLIAIVTGAASQRHAESQALQRCNDDDAAKDADGPCYLYAVGDMVVLPQRRTTAMAPP